MFGEQLKETLKDVNKTHLADAIGCHRDTIARWMKGKQIPTVPLLMAMCQYLWQDQWAEAYLQWSTILFEQHKQQ